MMGARAILLVAAICAVGGDALAQQAGGLSNPLWSTTLDHDRGDARSSVVHARPAAIAARRGAAGKGGQRQSVDAGGEPPPFALVGTLVGEKEKFAVLLESGSQKVLRLAPGASASGWKIDDVASRSVKITRGGHSVTLELPKPVLTKSRRDEGERAVVPRDGD